MEAGEQQSIEAAPAKDQPAAAKDNSSTDPKESTSSKDEQDSNTTGDSSSKDERMAKIKTAEAYANSVKDRWKSFAAGACQPTNT
jgi:hypothetical protein